MTKLTTNTISDYSFILGGSKNRALIGKTQILLIFSCMAIIRKYFYLITNFPTGGIKYKYFSLFLVLDAYIDCSHKPMNST